jgi:hypothetical protein
MVTSSYLFAKRRINYLILLAKFSGEFFDCLTARFSFKDNAGFFFDSFELLRSLLICMTPSTHNA